MMKYFCGVLLTLGMMGCAKPSDEATVTMLCKERGLKCTVTYRPDGNFWSLHSRWTALAEKNRPCGDDYWLGDSNRSKEIALGELEARLRANKPPTWTYCQERHEIGGPQ
jgi:hypothetical protein